ncbi:type II and III secretion system protein [Thermosipho sp. 1063]|uniref:type II secretion system protein GspD n=1 Tax=unclassified Thermosipho (in: thermotogales) TaxID=2676525 RepID=UPI000949393F|nr:MULTISPECIES: type II and III secretion system protein [unclassified Thermosipho (in: thermotogales)]ANQ52966.1 type II and III secretion system protein [Thermosipho sp. 1070]APT71413.1 type II and III secretion system protein [Thermosipho sp. 1063]OOC46067.1 type II and III secretion system protein [Thermosipho sp. 1074]
MRKKFLSLLFIMILFSFLFSKILNIDYYFVEDKLQVVLELDNEVLPSKVRFGWNDSKTVYYLSINGEFVQSSFLPVSKGPLEGIQLSPSENSADIFFFTIVPVNSDWYVVGNKIIVDFPSSVKDRKFSFSFLNAPLDVVIREFSKALGINISLYEGVRNIEVNLDVKDVTIEKALRLLFLNNPKVCYAYGPDGTLYLGLEEEINKNFAMYWQIYDGEVSAEKIKSLLGSGTFMSFLKDKSKVFVYGGIREHRIISDAISVRPSKSWYYYSYTVSKNTVEEFLKNISSIYEFKYVVLEPLKQVAIYADTEISNTIGYLISTLRDNGIVDFYDYIDVKVRYPQRIASVLDSINIPYKMFGEVIKVPKIFKGLVEKINNDRSIGNPYRMVIESIKLDTVKSAISYLGIGENNAKVTEVNGKIFVTLFVTEELYKRFNQFIEIAGTKTARLKLDRSLLSKVKVLKEFDDGTYLIEGKEKIIEKLMRMTQNKKRYVLELTPFDPPKELFLSLIDATPVYYSDKTLIYDNIDDSLIAEIEKIRKQFGNEIVEIGVIDDNFKKILEELFGVTVYRLKNKVYIKGEKAKQAKEFFDKNSVSYKTEKVNVKIENFGEVQSIIKDLYNIETKYYPESKLLILRGTDENIKQAKKFLDNYNKGKVIKFVDLPYTDGIKSVVESTSSVKVFDLNGKILLVGEERELLEVEDLLNSIDAKQSIIEINSNVQNIEEFVKFNFEDRIKILNLNGKILAKGTPEDLKKLQERLRDFDEKIVNVEDEKLKIDVKDYNLKDLIERVFRAYGKDVVFESDIVGSVTLKVEGITLNNFEDYLKKYGIDIRKNGKIVYIEKTSKILNVKDGKISINATDVSIADMVREVYPKFGYAVIVDSVDEKLNLVLNKSTLEDFEKILTKKVDITKEGSIVYIEPKDQVKETEMKDFITFGKNKRFSISAENVQLREIIKQVVKGYGFSAVISKDINSTANLYVNELDFKEFEKILNHYNIEVKQEDGIYVFDSLTTDSTKTVNTFVFSVPRNVEKIQELIGFYGGNSFVDSAAGVVIATGIDAKISGEIKGYIEKYLNSKLALIEVRVVDEELTNSLDINLGEITSNIGTLSKNGFDITLSLGEMPLEKIIDKLLSIGSANELTVRLNGKMNLTDKDAKLLASPNIVAKSGEKASILIGDKIPIVLNAGENSQEIRYIESGVTLEIIPFVNADNTIDLELNIKVSSFDWDIKNQYGLALPLERTREFNSKISLKENETLIIGGLTREENSKTESKIPILGDLPIIGKFFKTEKDDKVKRNIVILISAKVVE